MVFRRVEYLEQLRQPAAEVRSIFLRAVLQKVEENVARLKDAGIIGEQTENDTDEELLEIMARIAGSGQRVVKLTDALGCFDVDRILVAEGALLDAEDETELFYVLGQIGEGEGDFLALVSIEQLKGLKVAEQLIARTVALRQGVEIGARLLASCRQIDPRALLLNEQHPRPE